MTVYTFCIPPTLEVSIPPFERLDNNQNLQEYQFSWHWDALVFYMIPEALAVISTMCMILLSDYVFDSNHQPV